MVSPVFAGWLALSSWLHLAQCASAVDLCAAPDDRTSLLQQKATLEQRYGTSSAQGKLSKQGSEHMEEQRDGTSLAQDKLSKQGSEQMERTAKEAGRRSNAPPWLKLGHHVRVKEKISFEEAARRLGERMLDDKDDEEDVATEAWLEGGIIVHISVSLEKYLHVLVYFTPEKILMVKGFDLLKKMEDDTANNPQPAQPVAVANPFDYKVGQAVDVKRNAPEGVEKWSPGTLAYIGEHQLLIAIPSNEMVTSVTKVSDMVIKLLPPADLEIQTYLKPACISMTKIDLVDGHGIIIEDDHFCARPTGREGDIGKGGQGSVTSGHIEGDWEGGRPVAIKTFLSTDVTASGEPKYEMPEDDRIHHAEKLDAEFNHEVDVLRHLRKNPEHIVTIYGADFATKTMAMEILSGRKMQDLRKGGAREMYPIRRLDLAAKIMKQVVEAISECHEHHVAHRDIKPDQFVWTEETIVRTSSLMEEEKDKELEWLADFGVLKLVDFGVARHIKGANFITRESAKQRWKDFAGDLDYMAPEMYRNGEVSRMARMWRSNNPGLSEQKMEDGRTWKSRDFQQLQTGEWQYDGKELEEYSVYQVDVWAIGVMALEMTTGETLFPQLHALDGDTFRWPDELWKVSDDHIRQVLDQAFRTLIGQLGEEELTYDKNQEALRDFLSRALKVKPNNRPTATKLLEAAWLKFA